MNVELVTVGDELLSGDTVNGNAAWLGRRLAETGVTVTRSAVVGDDLDVIVQSVTEALSRAGVVVVTGGLGPTSDDLTRDALAVAAGVGLRRDPATETSLRERSAAQGLPVSPLVLRMADVPEGAVLLPNPVGSAPGLRIKLPGGIVYALPGVPTEMRSMFDVAVLPELATAPPTAVWRTLRTAAVRESVLAARLASVESLAGVRLAYLPDPGEVRLRVTATGTGHQDAQVRLGAAEELIRDLLGAAVYGADGDTLDRVVHRLLAERAATVAVAESLTGGLLGAELTDMPGSSATFAGGVIPYATAQKTTLLGVPEELLAAHGAVHPQVAAAMAEGVRALLRASYGLAVTGVAGPEPQDGRPVGTVHIAVAETSGTTTHTTTHSPRLPVPGPGRHARAMIRRMTVLHALDLLRRRILGVDIAEKWYPAPADREDTF